MKVITIATILLFVFSCSDVIVVLPSQVPPVLIVRGVVYDGLPVHIFVTKAQAQITGEIDHSVGDAVVEIWKDGIPAFRLRPGLPRLFDFALSPATSDGTWYRTEGPVDLEPNATYELRIEAEGVPTLISNPITYLPVVSIDSIANLNDIITPDGNSFTDTIRLNTHIEVTNELKGELEVFFGLTGDPTPIADTTSLRSNFRQFDSYPRFDNYRYIDPKISDTIIPVAFVIDRTTYEPGRWKLRLEYTFFRQDYLDFLAVTAIGTRFEDVVSLDARIDNAPTNIQNGYGFFTIAERYRFDVPLPE